MHSSHPEGRTVSKTLSVMPSAKRLTTSLRDIGYSFESAVADLVDNSIAAEASEVRIQITFSGENSVILISDNGTGMSDDGITEAFRFGSRRTYEAGELGRYGLGLKTASLSQCRRLTAFTRDQKTGFVHARTLDLDFITQVNEWLITEPDDSKLKELAHETLRASGGTVVIWENLDRLLPNGSPDSAWARRKFATLGSRLHQHLGLVFHRFIAGENTDKVKIYINDEAVTAWDPYARSEHFTELVSEDSFEVDGAAARGKVRLKSYCLPARSQFSSPAAFEKAAGPRKWNRQQGIYVYRANRLVQWGGWDGIRTLDEHTKLARVSLDFDTELDDEFNINVAKMRVTLPSQLKKLVERSISEVCAKADSRYRKDSHIRTAPRETPEIKEELSAQAIADVGLTLKSVAIRSGHYRAFKEIAELMKQESPELASQLGL